MSKIKIIHIDDEKQTLEYCKKIFKNIDVLDYQEGFNSPIEAIEYLNGNKIDLIFCDIEMPIHNGLWVANNLPYNIPIVFITAHTGFAVDAFEACALHYLIKPLSIEQVNIVLTRFNNLAINQNVFKEQVAQFYNQYLPQSPKTYPTRIYINNIGRIIIVNLSELMYMEGAGNYTKFYMHNGDVHTSSKNLKMYDDSIVYQPNFIRIHRSHIINKEFVKQIIKLNTHQWYIEMRNDEKLEISKGKLDEILEQIQH